MKKKNQSFQADTDFDGFDVVSSADTDSGFDSFDSVPSSGAGSDFDFPAGNEDHTAGGSFSDGMDDFTPSVKRRSSGGKGSFVAIVAVVIVLVLGIAGFLLIPRNTETVTVAGTSSPTGKTAFLTPGCELLLNELLVTADSTLSRKQIEEELAKLDGAVVGYLPVLNQYQIRFNTDTKTALDEKKQAMEALSGVIRTDYNYLLEISVSPAEIRAYDLPDLQQNTLGLLGGLPPETVSSDGCFLLSSSSTEAVPAEELPIWLSDHKGSILPAYRADQAAALLNRTEPQFFASCFFYEANQDGTVSGYTTTCALRYQMFCLISAGAETIAFPFTGPLAGSSESLPAENELNELFFAEMEKDHPSFMFCKAWKEQDFLISMFTGTETGKRHLITVSSFSSDPVAVLDAASAGNPVCLSEAETGGADLAVRGNGAETSVVLAAAQLASLRASLAESDPSGLKSALLSSCGVLVADSSGIVTPGFDPAVSGNYSAGSYRLMKLTARDSRTGEIVPNVTFTASAGAGSFSETSASGSLLFLLPDSSFSISAEADHYRQAAADRFPEHGNEAVVYLAGTQPCGIVSGRISLSGGGIQENLVVRFRNTRTGEESADMPLDANFRLEVNPGEYDMIVTGRNRTAVTIHNVSVTEGSETEIPVFALSVLSDLPGTASGMIKDAMTGGPLEGVTLNIFEGVNAPETDHPVVSVVSDQNGLYSARLPGGVYTAYLSKAGYRSDKMQITAEGEITIGDQDCVITPTIPEGSVRIVLEWGPHPDDLDSHLVNADQGIHTYYEQKEHILQGEAVVTLDVDALDPMKPDKSNRVETTTIRKQLPGRYVFYIQDFSDRNSSNSHIMAESGAKITVYIGEETKYVFDVPDADGTLWEVFTLENGILTPSGTVTYHSDPKSVGR